MIKNAIKRYTSYLATVRELEMMTDRELHDIGVSRYDIKKIAKSANK